MSDSSKQAGAGFKDQDLVARYEARQDQRVPGRNEMYRAMLEMFPPGSDGATFLELGCGRGSFSKLVLERFPHARMILLDFSAAMLSAAEVHLAAYAPRISLVQADFSSISWFDKLPGGIQAAVSTHAIHHLSQERKRQLYREIHALTNERGFFLNGDLVLPDDPTFASWFNEVWVDFIHVHAMLRAAERGETLSREKVRARHYEAIAEEGDNPASTRAQLEWLIEAGFVTALPFWQYFCFAAFAAYKDASSLSLQPTSTMKDNDHG